MSDDDTTAEHDDVPRWMLVTSAVAGFLLDLLKSGKGSSTWGSSSDSCGSSDGGG
jgi:hypothetical protein